MSRSITRLGMTAPGAQRTMLSFDDADALDGALLRPRIDVFLDRSVSGYANLVGDSADAVTFFVGSVLRRSAPDVARPGRHDSPGAGRAASRSALVQTAGTLFFNVTTFQALHTALSSSEYDRLVWRPNALGSVCFLVSGAIAYRASARHGWLPTRAQSGCWEPGINLPGCIFFGIAAVAGYVDPSTGSVFAQAAANWHTCLGAACFLVVLC